MLHCSLIGVQTPIWEFVDHEQAKTKLIQQHPASQTLITQNMHVNQHINPTMFIWV